MKTMTLQTRYRSIALAVAVACVAALPVHAERWNGYSADEQTPSKSASKQEKSES